MPTSHRDPLATAAAESSEPATTPGTYLTDGVGLYRVEAVVRRDGRSLLVLEDCAWLEHIAWPAAVLTAIGMRVVAPGSAA